MLRKKIINGILYVDTGKCENQPESNKAYVHWWKLHRKGLCSWETGQFYSSYFENEWTRKKIWI